MADMSKTLKVSSGNQDLFTKLNDENAETISGGRFERFIISNQTKNIRIPYTVDGKRTPNPNPGRRVLWTTNRGGIVNFDFDFRRPGVQSRKFNLANGRRYAFRLNKRTRNPFDINLYKVG